LSLTYQPRTALSKGDLEFLLSHVFFVQIKIFSAARASFFAAPATLAGARSLRPEVENLPYQGGC
jgi:uncharacterized membrane protein YhhN